MKEQNIKKAVREGYAKVATGSSCCSGQITDCCGNKDVAKEISSNIGYSNEDLEKVPEGSNLGLGCGNPIALASLKSGEVVLDLGSGAGFDCFLAADKVGSKGKVIGIDMTPEMIEKARENAKKAGIGNVEFKLGEIENLPVSDSTIDIIISNCVINLSPDKDKVFNEAFRVLKPGGRIMVSDIVLKRELPQHIKDDISAYVSCISGAILKDDYLSTIKQTGFTNIRVLDEASFPINYIVSDDTIKIIKNNIDSDLLDDLKDTVSSIKVSAIKP
jgi:SAM-dependent methyltransferase